MVSDIRCPNFFVLQLPEVVSIVFNFSEPSPCLLAQLLSRAPLTDIFIFLH